MNPDNSEAQVVNSISDHATPPANAMAEATPADGPERTIAGEADARIASLCSAAARSVGQRNMFVGALWCVGGILVTAVTYGLAASLPAGGTYLVAWGAIVFGALQFFRGLAQTSSAGPSAPGLFMPAAAEPEHLLTVASEEARSELAAIKAELARLRPARCSRFGAAAAGAMGGGAAAVWLAAHCHSEALLLAGLAGAALGLGLVKIYLHLSPPHRALAQRIATLKERKETLAETLEL